MEIRAYVRKHPKQDWQEVGNHFNVNPGRISEVMKGTPHLKQTAPRPTRQPPRNSGSGLACQPGLSGKCVVCGTGECARYGE
jgi:hypothetical protein